MIYTAAFLFLLSVVTATAQTMTAAEIREVVDQELASQDEYLSLLGDPDPRRSRAAIRAMMGSGDVDLVRLALDVGLVSDDPVVRRVALEAFFGSSPLLQVMLDGAAVENRSWFNSNIESARGTVDVSGKGFFVSKIGEFDPAQSCWLWSDGKRCAVALNDSGPVIQMFTGWSTMTLTEDGVLVGQTNMNGVTEPVPFAIPVRP
jgi:hypothetical protein